MAEVQSSSAVEPKGRPEKPDDGTYKAALAKAEKEHASVLEKLVRRFGFQYLFRLLACKDVFSALSHRNDT